MAGRNLERVRVPGPEGEVSEVVYAKNYGNGVVQIQNDCFEDNPQGLQYGSFAHVVIGADGFPETAGEADKPGLLTRLVSPLFR